MADYDKQRYVEYCNKEECIPIYSQPWWMDCMCGENGWDVFLVGEGSDIKASFVYRITGEGSSRKICRALLTQNNGIHISYPEGQGIISRQKYEENIIDLILDHIESLNLESYEQQYNWRFTNWLPFYWRYYKECVKYTYVIGDTSDMSVVRAGYSSNTRKNIKKASKYVKTVELTDLKEFYAVNELSFKRQGIEIPYSYEIFEKLYRTCKEHNCVKLLGTRDDDGRTHSVAMLVWDNESVYFLLNGTDPDLKAFQSNCLLIDSCIEVANELGRSFDFEGSVIRPVNRAFREFGGQPMPYFRIYKEFETGRENRCSLEI